MADNVTLPGTGAVISAEEVTTLNGGAVAAQQAQRMLAALRTADATAIDLPGDATNGLDVDVTRSVLPTGASTETTLATRLSESDFDTKVGSLTEGAPASDTASSGLNGRLQRIAQRITSLIALIPSALTGSGNFKIALVESTASQAVTGTFWQATQPVSGTVGLSASTTRVGATYDTGGQIQDEAGTLRTVQRAFVNATGAGNTEVVAAQGASIRIRVLSVKVVTATALTIKFQSATTDISPGESLAANGGFVLPRNVDGWFQTTANQALNVNLSGAGTVGVTITWVQAT